MQQQMLLEHCFSKIITASSNATTNAFGSLLQQLQMAEEFEWKQHRLEHEKEHLRHEDKQARHEEELHEMRRKKSRHQEQMNQLFQLAMTGLMGHWGINKKKNDGEDK
jgi:uncharacterized protein YdaU (DUF1376 family)